MNIERLHERLVDNWPLCALYGGLFLATAFLLLWHLGDLVPGFSPAEQATYHASQSLSGILEQPLNAPFYLVVKLLSYLLSDTLLLTRAVAVLFGVGVLGSFALLVRQWHDTATTIITTMLFGCSAWFLHTARLGTPEVLLFGLFVLVACGIWLRRTQHWLPLVCCFLLTAALLYVPGMIWFIVLGVIWQWKVVDRAIKKHLLTASLVTLVLLAALAPLGWVLYKDHGLIMPLLGLPEHWPAPLVMLENLLKVPFYLLIHNQAQPEKWLGTAPIFDAFSLAMLGLGSYLFVRHIQLTRASLTAAFVVLLAILMAVGSNITFTVILPFLYLIIASGIAYLLGTWFTVFPRNPIARTIGWIVAGATIALVLSFHLTHYFVGWPQATATNRIFTVQKP